MLPDSGVSTEQVLGELSRPEGVDAAFVPSDRRRGAVRRALGLEARPLAPAYVVPGEGLEPVRAFVAAHMPKSPGNDRDAAGDHAGNGSAAGSSARPGAGSGSSCASTSAPRSV